MGERHRCRQRVARRLRRGGRRSPVRIIRAPRNGGFAYGCNLGIAAGTAEFVLLLNPDARIESASLSTLVSALRADPALGGVGPRTLGDGGQLQWTQRRFPRLRSTYSQALGLHRVAPLASWTGEVIRNRPAYTRPATPDWLSGGVRAAAPGGARRRRGNGRGFFLYSEETDLFRRLRGRGWRARFEPQATAYHQGYGSAPWETVTPDPGPKPRPLRAQTSRCAGRASGGDRRGDRRSRSCRRLGPPSGAPSRASRSRAGRAERSPLVEPARDEARRLTRSRLHATERSSSWRGHPTRSPTSAEPWRQSPSRHSRPSKSALSDWRTPRAIADLGPRFPALLALHTQGLEGEVERNAFNRALVAHLASRLRFRLAELALPADVLERVPAALDRLHGFSGRAARRL